jgi:hypothetical protein
MLVKRTFVDAAEFPALGALPPNASAASTLVWAQRKKSSAVSAKPLIIRRDVRSAVVRAPGTNFRAKSGETQLRAQTCEFNLFAVRVR